MKSAFEAHEHGFDIHCACLCLKLQSTERYKQKIIADLLFGKLKPQTIIPAKQSAQHLNLQSASASTTGNVNRQREAWAELPTDDRQTTRLVVCIV
jgi:hypothetical protein